MILQVSESPGRFQTCTSSIKMGFSRTESARILVHRNKYIDMHIRRKSPILYVSPFIENVFVNTSSIVWLSLCF